MQGMFPAFQLAAPVFKDSEPFIDQRKNTRACFHAARPIVECPQQFRLHVAHLFDEPFF